MLTAVLALACLPHSTAPHEPATTPESAPFFPATQSVYVPSYEEGKAMGWTYWDVIRAYEQSTGHRVVTTPAAEEALRLGPSLREDGITLPPERVQKFFEGHLEELHLIVLPGNKEAPHLVGVASRRSHDREILPLEPYDIDWTEADQYRSHVCTLFRTLVPIQGTDGRALSNELRGSITDANVCKAVPLGGTNIALIQGPGNEVARLVDAFRKPAVDAGLAAPTPASTESAPQPARESNARFAGLQLTIPARGDVRWSVADLCAAYSKLTGETISLAEDVAVAAQSTLVGLSEDLVATDAEVPYVFEFFCRIKGFYLSLAESGKASTLRFTHQGEAAVARPSTLEELTNGAAHPARVVEVDLPMRNFDPRIIANFWRAFLGDPRIDEMTAQPGTQVLRMRGFASDVAGHVALFRKAEEMADSLRTADPNREE